MYGSEIKEVVAEYLRNKKAEYAVLIDGDWGSGKTHFLTHSLIGIMEDADLGKDERRKYAYVSLYGAKSIEEISKSIIFYYFGRKNKEKIKTIDTVINTASNIMTASLGAFNIDLSKIKELAEIDINNWILCFDDLERCCLPINEILGFINQLVEHNNCKVIILANENEIGKVNLNQNLESKYQVVLSGKNLIIDKENKDKNKDKSEFLDIDGLKNCTKQLFNNDILYKTIKEKAIGLTIKFESKMNEAYDSIIKDFYTSGDFKGYLAQNKETILKLFNEMECNNLRTLISVIGYLQKVYSEMQNSKYHTCEYYNQVMDEFLEYIVQFTIFYRSGRKVSDLNLTTEIGYVPLGKSLFKTTRGFKFLEKYCTTLSFSQKRFESVVSILRSEYKEIEKAKDKSGKAYSDLSYWWELEDDEVNQLISTLKNEVENDMYLFQSYQGIIAQLIILNKNGFNIGNMETLIENMNKNIESKSEPVDIHIFGHTFENDQESQNKFNDYVGKLKSKAESKNQSIKSSEITVCFSSVKWADNFLKYCENHHNEFLMRYRFIDLIDLDILLEKIKGASTKEIYIIRDTFKKVYCNNIYDFYINDKSKIIELREGVESIKVNVTGINKPKAFTSLFESLNEIIKRLEKNNYY